MRKGHACLTYSVDKNRKLVGLVVACLRTIEGSDCLLIICVCLYSVFSAEGETRGEGSIITVCITTSDAAASSVSLLRSDNDATTVLIPREFNNFALSTLRTSAVISNVSLLG